MYSGINEKKTVHLSFDVRTNNCFLIKMFPQKLNFSNLRDVLLFIIKFIPELRGKLENTILKLEQKGFDFSDNEKIAFSLYDISAEAKWNNIHLKKNKGQFFISAVIEVDNFECIPDIFVDKISNELVCECIHIVNSNSPQEEQLQLIEYIIGWMNQFHIISDIVMHLLCKNAQIKKQIDKYGIRIENIRSHYGKKES